MVEVIVAGAVVASGAAMLSRRQAASSVGSPSRVYAASHFTEASPDLPCPWCRASAAESDTHCPSCHQPFG